MLAPGAAELAFPLPGHAVPLRLFIDGAQEANGFSSSVTAARQGKAGSLHPQFTQTSALITLAAGHSYMATLQIFPV